MYMPHPAVNRRSFLRLERLSFAVVIAFLLCILPAETNAHSGGMTGVYQTGCFPCHGNRSDQTKISLVGANVVDAREESNYSVVIAHESLKYAGVNITVRSDTGTVGTLIPGPALRFEDGELTHNERQELVDGEFSFDFKWKAPTHGVYKLYVAANVTYSWNFLDPVEVVVKGATLRPPALGNYCGGDVVNLEWTQTGVRWLRAEMSTDSGVTWQLLSDSMDARLYEGEVAIPHTAVDISYPTIRLVDAESDTELDRLSMGEIKSGLVIVSQPVSGKYEVGAAVKLEVVSSGYAREYVWYKNSQLVYAGTTPVLSLEDVDSTHSGVYYVSISGNCNTIISELAVLVVGNPVEPAIRLASNSMTLEAATCATEVLLNVPIASYSTQVGSVSDVSLTAHGWSVDFSRTTLPFELPPAVISSLQIPVLLNSNAATSGQLLLTVTHGETPDVKLPIDVSILLAPPLIIKDTVKIPHLTEPIICLPFSTACKDLSIEQVEIIGLHADSVSLKGVSLPWSISANVEEVMCFNVPKGATQIKAEVVMYHSYGHDTVVLARQSPTSVSESEYRSYSGVQETGFSVYPNPANQVVQFTGPEVYTVMIYNTFGIKVFQANASGEYTWLLDPSVFAVAGGTYIVKFHVPGTGSVVTSKLVILK